MIFDEVVRQCLNEVKQDDYSIWSGKFMSYANNAISQLESDYLEDVGLKIELNPQYDFSETEWLAAYERSRGGVSRGIIPIAINLGLMYSCMKERKIDKDDFNIEAQARITIGHEIGHGIVDYLLNEYDGDCETVDDFIRDYWDGEIDEEELVEEFGESMFPKATGVYTCELSRILDEIISLGN